MPDHQYIAVTRLNFDMTSKVYLVISHPKIRQPVPKRSCYVVHAAKEKKVSKRVPNLNFSPI